ncbi:MAG: GIY-YIG catalytic domain protein [Bacteriophage sp.]|jgi:hypothetical protein|nr:MAG: GIY-YIG catalytic domain protein [Bacteriophage sp.]
MISGKYYLYRHIRLDKNEVFYIGVGTIQNKTGNGFYGKHLRAFSKSYRNDIWKYITGKTEYEVEIMLYSNDYEFILAKEIEFIKLYGKIVDCNGTLCNITDGGEGKLGVHYKMKDDTKIKISQSLINKPKTIEHIEKLKAAKLKNPVKYWKNKTFSNEHKNNLSEKRKLLFNDDNFKKQYLESIKKRFANLSDDDRKKISERNRKSGFTRYAKTYKVECEDEILIIKTTKEDLCKMYNIPHTSLNRAIKNNKSINGVKITILNNE